MTPESALFSAIHEPYAAGIFENPDKGYFYRHCLGYARYFEALPPAKYDAGEMLYPGKQKFFCSGCAMVPHYAQTYAINWNKLTAKSETAASILKTFTDISYNPSGWTHAAPNYARILREGLSSYRDRILARPEGEEFREGLLALINGIENWLQRSIAYLKTTEAPSQLIAALEKVPFGIPETYYEGLVAWNVIFYLDGADNLGILDDGLIHLYRGEDYTDIIGEMFSNLDALGMWSCTVGHHYNAITAQAIRAVKGRRRPMLEVMVSDDMPDSLWELVIENIQTGSCNPSFYNRDGIYQMLKDRFPQIPDAEIQTFCGCGCTETNLQGITRVGGCDGHVPLARYFEQYMHTHLASASSFSQFYEGLCQETEARINAYLDRVNEYYLYRASYLPNPPRTLLHDDCIDKGLDFNGGGTRYTWTLLAEAGLINVIDSLLAIRELVFRKRQFTGETFLQKLSAEDPAFFAMLKQCPCYGTDNDDADALAAAYTHRVYSAFRNKKPFGFVDCHMITDHQFKRFEEAGKELGPTPDGRHAQDATCDSIGALRGKAVDGPTAMLKSAAKLPQNLAEGIAVLNLTLTKSLVKSSLRSLIEAYFAMGGTQVQVTVTSPEELQDAMVHPERHEDLVVRVGGYSEYFVNLTPGLQKTILERDIHAQS